jgi:hypothetical protein
MEPAVHFNQRIDEVTFEICPLFATCRMGSGVVGWGTACLREPVL